MTPVQLKNTARLRAATAAYPLKKVALIYSAITLGGSFLSLLLSFAVGLMMENAGGLSGMDTRAILETVSAVFSYAVQIVAPMLAMGFLHGAILTSREVPVSPKILLTGLKRWGYLLRYVLLQSVIILGLGYVAVQIATVIFTFLPGSEGAVDMVAALMEDPTALAGELSEAQLFQLLKALAPVYFISAILFVIAYIPVSYRLRLGTFRLMEESPVGAVKATVQSFRLMKGNCMALFKLDLSFWWYYLLLALLTGAITAAGFLPQMSDVAYIVAYGVYCLAFLAVEYKYLAYVQTTYAVFYDSLLQQNTAPMQPQITE